jgi:isocitrate dehydrogenase
MFEAIHGSAPRRAGQNVANPSGLLMAGVMLLVHIGQPNIAARVHNAWLRTIEDGVHTYDIHSPDVSREKVGTREFAQAVVERLGQVPDRLAPVEYQAMAASRSEQPRPGPPAQARKELVGVDVFLHWPHRSPDDLGEAVRQLSGSGLTLSMISNRGTKVWPEGLPETFCVDHWRCRFERTDGSLSNRQVIQLLQRIDDAGYDIIKTENLYTFDGQPGFSLGQGQ